MVNRLRKCQYAGQITSGWKVRDPQTNLAAERIHGTMTRVCQMVHVLQENIVLCRNVAARYTESFFVVLDGKIVPVFFSCVFFSST